MGVSGVSDETPSSPEGGEEQQSGLKPSHERVARLLTQLAATARSFLLYDARNEAVRDSLAALLESLAATLQATGGFLLEVQPFEMRCEGAAVYLNRDRERSLAFRLYRDGVRSLGFRPGFDWEELSKLLEVLAVRYVGVHQHEDDMVTLLWKASFRNLDIVAVEGFVPDEEDAGSGPGHAAEDSGPVFVEGVDLAPPALPAPIAQSWVPVPPEALEALRAEASASALPGDCLLLLARLRPLLRDPGLRATLGEVQHLLTEVRDFLLADEHLSLLRGFLVFLRELAGEEPPEWDPERRAALEELRGSCGEYRAVARLLHSVPLEERRLRPELVEVLDLACADPLATLAAVLAGERGVASRAVARQLLEHYGPARLDFLERQMQQASGPIASDLLRVIAHLGGERVAVSVARQCAHAEAEVQEEALWHLERWPYSPALGRALFDAYRRADRPRRARLLALIARSGDRRFADHLAGHAEANARALEPEEGEEIGRALGRLSGPAGLPRFRAWLAPGGLLRRAIAQPPALQVAAGAALAELPGDEAAQTLREALAIAGDEVRPWLGRALARHGHRPAGERA